MEQTQIEYINPVSVAVPFSAPFSISPSVSGEVNFHCQFWQFAFSRALYSLFLLKFLFYFIKLQKEISGVVPEIFMFLLD